MSEKVRIIEFKNPYLMNNTVKIDIKTEKGWKSVLFFPDDTLEVPAKIIPSKMVGFFNPISVGKNLSYPFLHELFHLDERFWFKWESFPIKTLLTGLHKLKLIESEGKKIVKSTGTYQISVDLVNLVENIVEDFLIDFFLTTSEKVSKEEIKELRGMINPPFIGKSIISLVLGNIYGLISTIYERQILGKSYVLWFYDIEYPEVLEEELLDIAEELILGKKEFKTKLELLLFGLFLKGFSWEIRELSKEVPQQKIFSRILFDEWFSVK
ncbi:hypothetical protein DRP07_09275 [Archaeoglobales archaeon]|nr:MAG: hypothetical protein DRP07_09275 [Archaeoglobales archaeon]